MHNEWEVKFLNIDKASLRKRLSDVGAVLVKPETLYKRSVYFLPSGHEIEGGWVRVRDEGDKITMSLKVVNNGNVEDQKEVQLTVDNYDEAKNFLSMTGFVEKAYQETLRELWKHDNCEITLDEWPYLEPYVEIEGVSKEVIQKMSVLLGFDYAVGIFGSADQIISKKYGVSEEIINDKISRIVFNEPNPYLPWKGK